MKYSNLFAVSFLMAAVIVSGCVGQAPGENQTTDNQTHVTGSCRLSLCDCSCHTGAITEDTGALCGINCARYGGVTGCEIQNNECIPIYNRELQAKYTCIDLCEAALHNDIDLTDGPCLSDLGLGWNVPGYVCDIRHEPRQAVDNLAENQCSSYLNGTVHYFVEVTPKCEYLGAGTNFIT